MARVREKSRVAVRYKMERERRAAAAIAVIYAAVEGVGSGRWSVRPWCADATHD